MLEFLLSVSETILHADEGKESTGADKEEPAAVTSSPALSHTNQPARLGQSPIGSPSVAPKREASGTSANTNVATPAPTATATGPTTEETGSIDDKALTTAIEHLLKAFRRAAHLCRVWLRPKKYKVMIHSYITDTQYVHAQPLTNAFLYIERERSYLGCRQGSIGSGRKNAERGGCPHDDLEDRVRGQRSHL